MKVRIDTRQAWPTYSCSIAGCKNQPVFRHHKGNDKYLGFFNTKIKKDYWKFKHVCRVCDEHHMRLHYLYIRYMKRHKDWSPRGVRHLWRKLIRVCDRVIAGELKLPNPPSEFKSQWQTSKQNWESLRLLKRT